MNFFGNNTEKYILKEKEVKKIDKDGNENLSLYLTKDLCWVYHQNLPIMSQEEFKKLNVKTIIFFLNTEVSKAI